MQTLTAESSATWQQFFRTNRFQLIVSLVFLAAMAVFFYQTKESLASEPIKALYWFGGAILACETLLDFAGWEGKKGAVTSLLLRLLTFIVAGWAIQLS